MEGKTAEVLADVSVNGEDTAVEDARAKAENSSYENCWSSGSGNS